MKKYDKRTGALIWMPFIQKVLQQPFFTTDLLYKECEKMLVHLFPTNDTPDSSSEIAKASRANDPHHFLRRDQGWCDRIPKELAEIEHMKRLYMKSTSSAVRVLREIRSLSSTVSHLSLPPLQSGGVEESWNKKIPVTEQEAK